MPPSNARFQVEVENTTRLFYFFSLFGARTFATQQLPARVAIYDMALERYVHFEPDAKEALSIVRRANELVAGVGHVAAMRHAYSEWLRIAPLCRS